MTTVKVLIATENEKVKECIVIPNNDNDLEWGLRNALMKIYGGANVYSSSREIGHIPDNISRFALENYPRPIVKRNDWIPYTSNMSAPANGKRVLAKLANEWVCIVTYVLIPGGHGHKWLSDNQGQEIINVVAWKGLEE